MRHHISRILRWLDHHIGEPLPARSMEWIGPFPSQSTSSSSYNWRIQGMSDGDNS